MGHKRLVTSDPSKSYPLFLKNVRTLLNETKVPNSPVVIDMSDKTGETKLSDLIKKQPVSKIIDNYAEQYAELLLSKNAHLYTANYDVQVSSISDLLKKHYGKKQPWQLGSWVYYHWSGELVHVLNQEDFEELRTNRNRDLITASEQKKLLGLNTVCFGMSVGSAGALSFALSGISRKIKLVDGAVISGSNLNRIMTGVSSVGKGKAQVIGRSIYEMNPYSTVNYFDKVTADNIADIF